jgi:hypothetical protein
MGRLFREFAVTLVGGDRIVIGGVADDDSHVVRAAVEIGGGRRPWLVVSPERAGLRCDVARVCVESGLGAPASPITMLVVTYGNDRPSRSICISLVPKGFFPQQDTGRLFGNIQAPRRIFHFRPCAIS